MKQFINEKTKFDFSFDFKQKFIVFYLCLFTSFFVFSSPRNKIDLSQLDRYIENAGVEWKVPGLAVAIVKDGQVVLAKGYGVRGFSKKDKVDEKTLFAIASNTKAFTAAALAMLVDEGKITWDDKVREYLPYFKLYDPYVSEEMTIRDLLCHRSGLKTFSGDLIWYETPYSTVEVIKRARFLKPAFGFRAGYGYSNILYMAAGEIIPAVTGIPWKDFVKERIFKPLGMNTSNTGTGELKNDGNMSAAHYVYPDGKTVTIPYTTSDNLGGAAAINSNAIEMAQWVKMLLNKGVYNDRRLLSEISIWEMWSPQVPLPVSPSAQKLFPSTHFRGYGLGWGLSDYYGYKIIAHSGALDGMISRVALVPELKLGLVVLTNSINNLPSAIMFRIIDSYLGIAPKDWSRILLDQYRDSSVKDLQRAVNIPEKKDIPSSYVPNLEDFTGLYSDPMYGDVKVSLANGKLVLDFLPAPILISDLTHLHYDTFQLKFRNILSFVPHGTGTVRFLRNKEGKVVEMKMDVPNNDFWFDEPVFKKI